MFKEIYKKKTFLGLNHVTLIPHLMAYLVVHGVYKFNKGRHIYNILLWFCH